jgi:hypothetical protein
VLPDHDMRRVFPRMEVERVSWFTGPTVDVPQEESVGPSPFSVST